MRGLLRPAPGDPRKQYKDNQRANFATETEVREQFQLTDTTVTPTALIPASIHDAHEEILRLLDPVDDVPSPEAAIVSGAVLLAGAHVLRSLASKDAAEQKHVSVGGSRVEAGKRFDVLMTMAASAEERAWQTLEPFLLDRASRQVADVTETTSILGKE